MKRLSERAAGAITYSTLALIAAAAVLLRVIPPWSKIFRDRRVVFAEVDPWSHMRQVDRLVAQLQFPSFFDAYRLHPSGQPVESPLVDFLIAGVARLAGLFTGGGLSAHRVDVIGAWTPPVLAALAVVVLYSLTVELFGKRGRVVALLAAALLAALPGAFLARSLLGYTDHHVLEVLLALCVLRCLIRALGDERTGRESDRSAWIAGVFLAAYLLAWTRGAMLLLVLIAWALLQIVVALHRASDLRRFRRVIARCFGLALVLTAPWVVGIPAMGLDLPLLAGGGLGVWAFAGLAERLYPLPRGRRMMLAALACGVLLAGLAATLLLSPAGDEVRSLAARFRPGPGSETVGETRPWLWVAGRLSVRGVWNDFTTSAILGALGLATLSFQALRTGSAPHLLFAVWSAAMLAATLVQARFGYYLTAAVAVLAAWFVVRFFAAGLHRAFAVAVVLLVALYPNLPRALTAASHPAPGPTAAWIESLDWLRENTPEPFGDPSAYFERDPLSTRPTRPNADPYGVVTWWDQGYWLTRIGRRIPVANPTQQGARETAAFFTAQSEEEGVEWMDRLAARYVLVDRGMALLPASGGSQLLGNLEAMLRWAGRESGDYYQIYMLRESGGERGERGGQPSRLRPQAFYLPAYYRSLGMRMFAFGGKAVEAATPVWVLELEPDDPDEPEHRVAGRRVVRASRSFSTLADAEAHIAAAPGERQLVGWDPFAPCVPIPALQSFERVYGSSALLLDRTPEVSVFAYRPPSRP